MKFKVNYIIDDFQDVYEYVYNSAMDNRYSSVFVNEEGPGYLENTAIDHDLFLITDIFYI